MQFKALPSASDNSSRQEMKTNSKRFKQIRSKAVIETE
jgi:hypothetical protein